MTVWGQGQADVSRRTGEALPNFRRGLPVPTEADWEWVAQNCAPIRRVRLNERGWQRVNRRLRMGGRRALTREEADVVPYGAEFVTVGSEPESVVGPTDVRTSGAGSADNSTSSNFPPVRSQGSLGSCSSFSTTYYQGTHNLAVVRGWDAAGGGDDYRLSPEWTYNMVNDGQDAGASLSENMRVMGDHGCATWSEFPYVTSDFRQWCLNSNVWRSALGRRMHDYYLVEDLYTSGGLELLKDVLDNGYVAGFQSYSPWNYDGWVKGAVGDDPSTTNDNPYVGQDICMCVVSQDWGHAMTIVGYNDGLWCDLNTNGVVDSGERGALKIANSWGTGWSESGFCWFAYDALKHVSAVSNGPSPPDRVYGFGYGNRATSCEAYVMTGREDAEPALLAAFTIRHAKRAQMTMKLGKGSPDTVTPVSTWTGAALSRDGGDYGFDGSTTGVTATFYLDMAAIEPELDVRRRYFVGLTDIESDSNGELFGVTLISVESNFSETVTVSSDPLSFIPTDGVADESTALAWIDFTYTSTSPPSAYYVNDASILNDVWCSGGGDDSASGTSSAEPKLTIQSVLDSYDLERGDTIYVDTGIYALTEDIRMTGEDGGSPSACVVVRGSPNGSVIDRVASGAGDYAFHLDEVEYVCLRDLVVTNGYEGVYFYRSHHCVVTNTEIRNCASAGMYLYESHHNRLEGVHVSASGADGLYLSTSDSNTVVRCIVYGCGDEGVANLYGMSNVLENCTIAYNSDDQVTTYGADSGILLRNSIVVASGSGDYCIRVSSGDYEGDYNDLYVDGSGYVGYAGGVRPDVGSWVSATGQDSNSVSVDPLFADVSGGDYHVQSAVGRWTSDGWAYDENQSPCIDAGAPLSRVGAEPVPHGSRINLGGYGGSGEASRSTGYGPVWWYSGDVIDTVAVRNDFAAANAGQLKWVARRAYETLTNGVAWTPGGAEEAAITNVVLSFGTHQNYLAVNVGQVKYVARPFYDWLGRQEGLTNYPWTGATATNDFAPANVGQVKQVFDFDVP